ncbi:MAG TPA: hypothetical protein VG711_07210, partial [Phycisphaerales bacterium]|nr:hypothetical protein [Phycisphaerales bacterium]
MPFRKCCFICCCLSAGIFVNWAAGAQMIAPNAAVPATEASDEKIADDPSRDGAHYELLKIV